MSIFSKFVLGMLFSVLLSGAALACDNCADGYYGGQQVYSCNAGLYDCRTETSYYHPPCNDGCYRHAGCYDGCYRRHDGWRSGYVHGFRDGFETARYEGEDWRPHDGYHGDYYDDHRDGHDGDWHDGDHRDGWHDGDHRDDHHDGDRHDGH